MLELYSNLQEQSSTTQKAKREQFQQEQEAKREDAKRLAFKRVWSEHAEQLATWTMQTIVCRTDTYGVYASDGSNFRALNADRTPKPLTQDTLVRHFQSHHTVGLYSTNSNDMVRCITLDLDNHTGCPSIAQKNDWAMRRMTGKLVSLKMQFVAYGSDGRGGYHLWIPFAELVPYEKARSFGLWLARGHEAEVNPKGRVSGTSKQCGNYIRWIMPKPNRKNLPIFWNGRRWFWANTPQDAKEAISYLLTVKGNNPSQIPFEALAYKEMTLLKPDMNYSGEGHLDWSDIGKRYAGDLTTLDWAGVFEDRGMLTRSAGADCWEVICPWHNEHTTGQSAYIFKEDGKYPGYHCHHSHCKDRKILDVLGWFPDEEIDTHCSMQFGGKANGDYDRAASFYENIATMPTQEVRVVGLLAPLHIQDDQGKPVEAQHIQDSQGKPVEAQHIQDSQGKPVEAQHILDDQGKPVEAQHDSRIAYLWRGHHANNKNVVEADRQARAKSVLEAFAILPPTGFLPDFLATYLPTTDLSCQLFLGASLTTASSILGRSVWVENGGRRIHPSLWSALIASSGERKSSAVNLLKKMREHIAGFLSGGDTTWADMASQLGVEVERKEDGEWDWLAAQQSIASQPASWNKGVCTLAIDEISGWVKKLDQTYNAGLKETLTGAYEAQDWVEKTTKENAYLIHRPCINLLGASTPAWLADTTCEGDIRGGFLGRFMFFVSRGKDYILPICDKPNEEAKERLLHHIAKLKECRGAIILTDDALDAYCDWVKAQHVPERIEAWGSRLGNWVFKFAMLFRLTAHYGGPIQVEDVQRACKLAAMLFKDLGEFVADNLPQSKEEADMLKILSVIKRGGPRIPRYVAQKNSHMLKGQFDKIVETLHGQGDIDVEEEVGYNGRKSHYFTATGEK